MITKDKRIQLKKSANEQLFKQSGEVTINSKLVSFLYELMRDHMLPADVEKIMFNVGDAVDIQYTNGWLAKYAEDIANRLK